MAIQKHRETRIQASNKVLIGFLLAQSINRCKRRVSVSDLPPFFESHEAIIKLDEDTCIFRRMIRPNLASTSIDELAEQTKSGVRYFPIADLNDLAFNQGQSVVLCRCLSMNLMHIDCRRRRCYPVCGDWQCGSKCVVTRLGI
jgi:hypothetical protein